MRIVDRGGKRVGFVLAAVAVATLLAGGYGWVWAGPSDAEAGKAAEPSKADDHPRVILDTTQGKIVVELDRKKAPITVDNFLRYVKEGFYDGTVFHRVIQNFMIQCGGMDTDLKRKATHAPIKNEADNGLKNRTGTIAMARTSVVDSATSQFFINCRDNPFLDHRDTSSRGYGYAVFGRVVEGVDVVKKIEKVATTSRGGHQNVPVEDVVIRSAKIAKP